MACSNDQRFRTKLPINYYCISPALVPVLGSFYALRRWHRKKKERSRDESDPTAGDFSKLFNGGQVKWETEGGARPQRGVWGAEERNTAAAGDSHLEEVDLAVEDLELQLQPAAAAQVRVPRRRLGPRRLQHHRRLLPHRPHLTCAGG